MWGRFSTEIYNNAAPGITAAVSMVIIDRTKKKASQIGTGSQIARFEEEEFRQAG